MMTDAELQQLRGMLTLQRHALLGTLCAVATGEDRFIEPGFLRLLADLQTAIAAVEAALAESVTTGDAS